MTYTYTKTKTYILTSTHTYTYSYNCTCIYLYLYIYIYIYIYIYRNPKKHCFVNVFLQIICSVLITTHQKCISIIVSKVKFQNAYSLQHIKHLVHTTWKHQNCNCLRTIVFFTGETQEDACECLMLLIEIMDKGFGLCPTNYNISSKGLFSEKKNTIICDICTVKSPAFEITSLLYVTTNDYSSMQELLMQEHKQKLYKTCSCCGRDIWHI